MTSQGDLGLSKSDLILWQGDCLELMKNIPAGSVDMILTDPPQLYGTTACKWDNVIPFEPMWEQVWRVLKPNGACLLFGSEPFSSALRMSQIKRFKYDWVWDKGSASNFVNAKRQPLKYHEMISVFAKSSVYYPQKSTGKPNHSRNEGSLRKSEFYTSVDRHFASDTSGQKYPRSIIAFLKHASQSKFHPTQKPVALLEYLIKTYTLEGETILDFTMGSGSTGVAAKNLNRKFIGIEKDENYFKIAQERLNA